jgi:hypothetical protein
MQSRFDVMLTRGAITSCQVWLSMHATWRGWLPVLVVVSQWQEQQSAGDYRFPSIDGFLRPVARQFRMEILPRFELVDDHQQPVKTLIARELTIDMEEAAADVFRKWDGNTDSLGRFDDGFGKCLWSPFF